MARHRETKASTLSIDASILLHTFSAASSNGSRWVYRGRIDLNRIEGKDSGITDKMRLLLVVVALMCSPMYTFGRACAESAAGGDDEFSSQVDDAVKHLDDVASDMLEKVRALQKLSSILAATRNGYRVAASINQQMEVLERLLDEADRVSDTFEPFA